jgi:hypothetical protein
MFSNAWVYLAIGNFTEGGALSGGEEQSRGRVPRERRHEDMIEQRSIDERRRTSAALDEARLRQQAIGVRLRQMFDEVVNEQVPDEFLEILRRADKRSSENG